MRSTLAAAVAIYFGAWSAAAVLAVWLAPAAGYPLWLGLVAVFVLFWLVNGSLAYRYRARQLRQEGREPPPFLTYLFFPKPFSFRDAIPVARPVRIILAAVVSIGGLFLLATSAIILFAHDMSKAPHPVAGLIAVILLAGVGVGSLYMGVRLLKTNAA